MGDPAAGRGLDWSAARTASARLRTCVGCRRRGPSTDLLRVVAVEGELVPDPRRRIAGRGAHLHPTDDCLALAERRRAWPRALRVPGPLDTARLAAYLGQTEACSDPGKTGDPIR